MNNSLNIFAQTKLDTLDARSQRRELKITRRGPAKKSDDLISFTDNDYLGLSTHPRVIDASVKATKNYGAGSGASRLVTGNHPLYAELEEKLALWKGCEAALVFGSGFLANSGIIPALIGQDDLVLADEFAHASMHTGIKVSGATARFFKHNDSSHARQILKECRKNYRHILILAEGVYSMDGDIAPLDKLVSIAEDYDCWLMTDDAHALGVIGDGRGSAHHLGVAGKIPLMMGTLSKALGTYGGYLGASRPVIDMMKSRARSLVYTTGLPPGAVGGALEALTILTQNPALGQRAINHAKRFARVLDLPEPETPIVPVIVGHEDTALAADKFFQTEGFRVAAIRPPTVPTGKSRLRFSFSAAHSLGDVDRLINAAKQYGLTNAVVAV